MEPKRRRLLLHGPMPPPLGGMATYSQDFLSSAVAEAFEVIMCRSQVIGWVHSTRGLLNKMLRVLNAFCITFVWIWRLVVCRPAVVHVMTNSFSGFYIRANLCRWARRLNVPSVLHIHGGKFAEFYEGSSAKGQQRIRRCLAISDRVIVLSEKWRTFYESIGVAPERLVVLLNSVYLPELCAQPDGGGDRVMLISVAMLVADKGAFDIVRAVRESELLRREARVILAGPKSHQWQDVADTVTAAGLTEVIELPGPVDGDAKDALYRQAQVFLLPSYAEGLPIGLLEAMSYGLPCITTPVGGIPDVVTDGDSAILIAPGDVPALMVAMERLVVSVDLRREMGNRGRAIIEQKHSWVHGSEALVQLYESLTE